MRFTRTEIPDVMLIQPEVFEDGRGSFFEFYNRELFAKNGIPEEFIQDNHSRSSRGVLRGLHYQKEPRAQAKLVRVIRGSVFDVVVDIRKGSKTFGGHVSHLLSGNNRTMIYIPAGFAHGFCALEDGTEFIYKVSDYYSREHERGIRWDDPAIGIRWPKVEGGYVLSEKDKKHPTLKEARIGG